MPAEAAYFSSFIFKVTKFFICIFLVMQMLYLYISSDSGEVLTQMGTGDFFGEIGILNLDGGVNRYVFSKINRIKLMLFY